MENTKKKIPGFLFSRNSKMFHVVVRLKDKPGALSGVLQSLRASVDIICSVSYVTEDGGAIWSAFVKPLSRAETESKLEKLAMGSAFVEDCQVKGSDHGLMVDTLHSGVEYGPGRPGLIMPLSGVSRMNRALVEEFGSGGETVLYEEGRALGRASGDYLNSLLGRANPMWKVEAHAGLYRSLGWGIPSLQTERPGFTYVFRFNDCFECFEPDKVRKGCVFLRGHVAGTLSSLFGSEFQGEERKCRLRGGSVCEFRMTRVEQA